MLINYSIITSQAFLYGCTFWIIMTITRLLSFVHVKKSKTRVSPHWHNWLFSYVWTLTSINFSLYLIYFTMIVINCFLVNLIYDDHGNCRPSNNFVNFNLQMVNFEVKWSIRDDEWFFLFSFSPHKSVYDIYKCVFNKRGWAIKCFDLINIQSIFFFFYV